MATDLQPEALPSETQEPHDNTDDSCEGVSDHETGVVGMESMTEE